MHLLLLLHLLLFLLDLLLVLVEILSLLSFTPCLLQALLSCIKSEPLLRGQTVEGNLAVKPSLAWHVLQNHYVSEFVTEIDN